MRTCPICDLAFSKPYNLRRHMATIHPSAAPLPLDRQRRFGSRCQTKYTYQMSGKGYKRSEEDDMDQSSDDEESNIVPRGYINSPNGRRSRDIFDDSDSNIKSSDDDADDSDTDTESNPDSHNSCKYAAFQQFYDETERVGDEEEMTIDERRNHFRDKILRVTLTYFDLKKDPTFKKVMETVMDFKSGAGGYDMDEALELGFEQRRYLLDRVYDYLEEQAEGSEDEESDIEDTDSNEDEKENVSYRVAKEFPSVYS